MSLQLPSTKVNVQDGGLGIVTTPSLDVCVVMGCAAKGPYTSREITQTDRLKSDFGAGPAVKSAAYSIDKTGAKVVFLRLPKVARNAQIKDVVIPSGKTATITGTPNEGYDIVVECTANGTVGSAPGPTLKWSKDGGVNFTSPAALGGGTTLTLTGTGLTVNFTGSDAYTSGQQITAWTIPAAESIGPVTTTRGKPATPSTSVFSFSGSPIDDYEILVEFLTDGTVETDGITLRYSLDGGRKWSGTKALGTNDTLELFDAAGLDESVSTGITLELAAGTVHAGDKAAAVAFGPTWQAADALTAIDTLMSAALSWRFFHCVGWQARAAIASVASKVGSIATGNATKHSFALLSARPKGTFEKASNWEARLLAEFATFGDVRTGVGAGQARITCPITGRANRRDILFPVVARIVSKTIQVDPGRRLDGPLGSDVLLHDSDQLLVEHDARVSSTLHGARFITLRTYYDTPGVFCTRGNLMAAEGSDFNRIAYRAVMDLGVAVFNQVMLAQLENDLRVNPPSNAPNAVPGAIPGTIYEVDARIIDREFLSALETALVESGYASAVQASVSRTDNFLSTGKLTAKMRITPKGYVDQFEGDAAFINPRFQGFQSA